MLLKLHPEYGYQTVDQLIVQEEVDKYYRSDYVNPTPMHDPERVYRIVSEFCRDPGRALDVGCGDGGLLEVLASHGWASTGIEPGMRAAVAARERGLTIIQDTLSGAMSQLGRYDLVVMASLLEHLADPGEAVEQAFSLLHPGGILYCLVPNDFNPLQKIAVREEGLDEWWIAAAHLNYFSHDTLARLVAGKGFHVIYRTTDFPMELFLLLGWNYVDHPSQGVIAHERRCRFEQSVGGKFLDQFYDTLIELDIGRSAILCARRPW